MNFAHEDTLVELFTHPLNHYRKLLAGFTAFITIGVCLDGYKVFYPQHYTWADFISCMSTFLHPMVGSPSIYILDFYLPFLPANLCSWSLNLTFLLVFFFFGNFLRNTSAMVSGSIPGHDWVFFPLFSFFQWKFSGFGSQHFKSLRQNFKG